MGQTRVKAGHIELVQGSKYTKNVKRMRWICARDKRRSNRSKSIFSLWVIRVFARENARGDGPHIYTGVKPCVNQARNQGGCTGCVRTPPRAPKVRILILNNHVKECGRLN